MSDDVVVNVPYTSRHAAAELFLNGSTAIWALRDPIEAPIRRDDIYHTTVDGDRIEMLAYKFYGNVNLWWIIADYNAIAFPMKLQPGLNLRFPSKQRVEMEILP